MMTKSTKYKRSTGMAALTLGTALLLGACAAPSMQAQPGGLPAARIAEIIASPDRTPADLKNDERRKPAQVIAFIGVKPGSTALDVSAGGGYTTELLARAIGPTGRVYGQSPPRNPPRVSPLIEREARLRAANVPAAPMVAVAQPFNDPVPPDVANGGLDLVTLMFNYHDLGSMGVDRERMNRALFQALKPGGVYVVADHAGRPGTGISESGTLHRIEEAFVRREIEAAGFRLVAAGDFLRNPADPRDRETPEGDIKKDELILKFVKP